MCCSIQRLPPLPQLSPSVPASPASCCSLAGNSALLKPTVILSPGSFSALSVPICTSPFSYSVSVPRAWTKPCFPELAKCCMTFHRNGKNISLVPRWVISQNSRACSRHWCLGVLNVEAFWKYCWVIFLFPNLGIRNGWTFMSETF